MAPALVSLSGSNNPPTCRTVGTAIGACSWPVRAPHMVGAAIGTHPRASQWWWRAVQHPPPPPGQQVAPACRSPSCGSGPCLSLEPMMVAAACTCPQNACKWCLVAWEPTGRNRSTYGGPARLLRCPPTVVFCLSGRPRPLLSAHSVVTLQPFQAVSMQLPLVLSLGLTSEARASAPSPAHTSRQASQAGEHRAEVLTICAGPSTNWLLHSPPRL